MRTRETPLKCSTSAICRSPRTFRCYATLCVVTVAVCTIIGYLSPPGDRAITAIVVFSTILWATSAMNRGVVSVLMMSLLMAVGVPSQIALSGFSGNAFWLLLPALFYGLAMQKTQLAERISYLVLRRARCTYTGVLWSLFLIGIVLGLTVPSTTARVAIMVPIAWASMESAGAANDRGIALVMLSCIEMAILPGFAVLQGSLAGPALIAVFETKGLTLNWVEYAKINAFPALLLSAFVVAGNFVVLTPEKPSLSTPQIAEEKLRRLGRLSTKERTTGLVIVGSLLLWATQNYHQVAAHNIAMMGFVTLVVFRVVTTEDITRNIPWTLMLFYGGIFGLGNVLEKAKILEWLSTLFLPFVVKVSGNVTTFVLAMALMMFLLRFIFPSITFVVPFVFLLVIDASSRAGIPPLIIVAALLVSSSPFWFSYQNLWIAMGEEMTQYQGFSSAQRVRLANLYSALALLALVVSIVFWRASGILP